MFAIWIIFIGLVVGIIGDILFLNHNIGLSFTLYISIVVAVVLAASKLAQKKLWWRNLWPFAFVIIFAFMVVLRASPQLIFFNLIAIIVLTSLAIFYLPRSNPLDEGSLFDHFIAINEVWIGMLFSPLKTYGSAWSWARQQKWAEHELFFAIVRGLIITVPIVVLFAVLLGAADAVFGEYVSDALALVHISETSLQHILLTLILSIIITAMLSYGYMPRNYRYQIATAGDNPAAQLELESAATEQEETPRKFIRLGMVESGMLLGSLDVLFALFVIIQFTYFFGGEKNIEGMIYSEYARRGFFELVAVSVLTLSLMLLLDKISIQQGEGQLQIFRGLIIFMVGMMFVILVSASRRMNLYEQAFGYTQLRVYVDVFIYWLGILFIVFLLQMFRLKPNVFAFGILLVTIGYLLTLNIMNVDQYITSKNVERFKDGKQFDICYLQDLSLDGVPALLELYELTKDDEYAEIHTHIASRLRDRLRDAEDFYDPDDFFLFQHISVENAWQLLNPLRDEMQALEYVNPYDCYTYSR